MDETQPFARAVAVKDGRIISVGSKEQALSYGGEYTRMIDLGGSTVIPGLIESHMHPILYTESLLYLNFRPEEVDSIEKFLSAIRSACGKKPAGQWIVGRGYYDSRTVDRRWPTLEELDAASPYHPVAVRRTCSHITMLNTMALKLAGITAEMPEIEGGYAERDAQTGRLTGRVMGKLQWYLPIPKFTVEEIKDGLDVAQQNLLRGGVTTMSDLTCHRQNMHIYNQLSIEGRLKVRVSCWPGARDEQGCDPQLKPFLQAGLMSGFGSDMLKLGGVKFVLDGSTGGCTAAYDGSYEGKEGNNGYLYTTQESLNPDILAALNGGLRCAVHAIGERSIEQALRAFEYAQSQGVDVCGMRNRMEHAALMRPDQLERIRALNIVPGSSTGFIYSLGDSYIANLGQERAERCFPHKTWLEMGVRTAGNSDCDVTPFNPWLSIYGVVARRTAGGRSMGDEQRIGPP